MSFEIKGLFKSASLYVIANVLNGAIPFLLIPVFTRYLSPVDFGHIAMFTVLTNVFTTITSLNLPGAINRFYFDKDEYELPKLVGNSLLLILFSTAIGAVVLYACADLVYQYTEFPKEWLFAVVIASLFQVPINIALGLRRVQNQPIGYAKIQISSTLTQAMLALGFVVGLKFDWTGRVWGQSLGALLVGLICFIILHQTGLVHFRWNKKYSKHTLRFGAPMVLHLLGGIAFTSADRVILTNLTSLHETGLYAVAAQVAAVIHTLSDSFNRAYSPWLFGILKSATDNTKRMLVKLTYLHFLIALGVCLLIALSTKLLFGTFISAKFSGASAYIYWLCLAAYIRACYLMVTNYIIYSKKTERLAFITTISGLINIALSYYFISKYGALGAARGLAVAQLLQFAMTWIIAQHTQPMPWLSFCQHKKTAV